LAEDTSCERIKGRYSSSLWSARRTPGAAPPPRMLALQTALPAALSALGAGARPGSFQRCSLSPCARRAGLHVASATEPGKVSAALALSSQLNV